jgi:hypothetical protein
MAKTVLGNLLVSKLVGGENKTPIENMIAFVGCIADFITSNVTLIGSFTGATTTTPPVPITAAPTTDAVNASIMKGLGATIVPVPPAEGSDGSAEWMAWVIQLYSTIATGVLFTGTSTTPTPPIPAFPTMITPTWSRNDLKAVVEGGSSDVQGDCMDTIANGIVNDLNINFVKAVPGTYPGGFIGVTTITKANIIN